MIWVLAKTLKAVMAISEDQVDQKRDIQNGVVNPELKGGCVYTSVEDMIDNFVAKALAIYFGMISRLHLARVQR